MSTPTEQEVLTPQEQKISEAQKKIVDIEDKLQMELRSIEKKHSEAMGVVFSERGEAIKAISGFWKSCMQNHYLINQYFSDEDWEITSSLKDLSVEENYSVLDGYKIIFTFGDNVFFNNTNLWKSYTWDKEKKIYTTESSKVEWKEGKNLCQVNKDFKEKESNGSLGQEDSYHYWGEFEEQPEDGEDEIAEIIRDEIWEDPLKMFKTELVHEDEEDEEEEEGEEN